VRKRKGSRSRSISDAFFDSLVRNAIEFLQRSMKELENQPKYAVIDFCTALELFPKARLLKEHWDSAPNRYLVGPPTAADICRRPPVWLPRMSHSDQQNTWPSCRAGRRRARSHLEITTERATVSGIRSLEAVDQGRGFPVVPRLPLRPHCRRSFSGSAGLATGVGLGQRQVSTSQVSRLPGPPSKLNID
jgi:hypothetical protein